MTIILPPPPPKFGDDIFAIEGLSSRVVLYHGDALDVLPMLESVDAVITDPPYSITSEASSSISRASRNVRETQFFEAWLREQVGALVKVCKPSAGLWMSLDWRGAMVLDTVCAKLNLKEPKIGVWDKESIGMGGVLRNSYECFAVVTLSEWENITRSERDVWQHRWTQGNRASSHPAEKPVALMERACQLLCKRGATVLDPYMGSGTTGIAAIKSGMNFIGIERDFEHYKATCIRIKGEIENSK